MSFHLLRCVYILFFIPACIVAQDSTFKNKTVNLGFQVNTISGLGLSLGINTSKYAAVRLTAITLASESSTFFDFGFEFQYMLVNNATERFYVGPGIGFYLSNDNSESVAGVGMGGAISIREISERLFVTASFFYPAFYKDMISIGGGLGFYFVL